MSKNGLSTGIGRSLQLGGLAGDLTRVRYSRGGAAEDARRRLVGRLAALHGLPQKVGQILSLAELGQQGGVFTALTEVPSATGAETFRRGLERELGPEVARFRRIGDTGIAASLAEVRRATLNDGRTVAVKLQREGIEAAIRFDLGALGVLAGPLAALRRGLGARADRGEIGRMATRELDYRLEARTLERFGSWAGQIPGLRVPSLVPELSRERVLTMTWIEGDPFARVASWPASDRRAAAEILLRFFLEGAFRRLEVHGDPHPGNYRFRRQGGQVQVGVLDFGCVQELRPECRTALAELVRRAIRDDLDPDAVLALYVEIGFKLDRLLPMMDRLPDVTRLLFEPIVAKGAFDLAGWNLSERADELLGPHRGDLRAAGPADIVFFMRAYQGLLQYLRGLNVAVDWGRVWQDAVPESAVSALERPRSPEPLAAVGAPGDSEALKLLVKEGERTKVELTFRPAVTARLSEVLPDDIRPRLLELGLDVEQIARRALEDGLRPQVLFELNDGERSVRVWLEARRPERLEAMCVPW